MPAVDHGVADLSGSDNETNVVPLCAFNFHVRLFVSSIAVQVVSYLLRFNRTDGPAILFISALNKFNGGSFHPAVGFDGAEPAPTASALGDWSLPSQSSGYNG
jgi:hypothetical protein